MIRSYFLSLRRTILYLVLLNLGNHSLAQQIAGGGAHSLAVCSDGTVMAWGRNDWGQLGDNSSAGRLTPVPVFGLTGAKAVAAGYSHSFAIKTDGSLWAWGINGNGQLGDSTIVNKSTVPVLITAISDVRSVAGGGYFSLGLKNDGTVWAWGYNSDGQLGIGTSTDRWKPVQVLGLTGAVSIAAGFSHSLAVKNDGTVWAWGLNNYGQLGDGTTTKRSSPVQVSGLTGMVAVAASEGYFSVALKNDGTVWAWGSNGSGQLGDSTFVDRHTPVQVKYLSGIKQISAGGYHVLAIDSNDVVWAWGYNSYGQLGIGTTGYAPIPQMSIGLGGSLLTAGGEYHSMAMKSDGTVRTFGRNNYGQLGTGSSANSSTPVLLSLCSVSVGIPVSHEATAIKIFPNPSNGDFMLINIPENSLIKIFNSLGDQIDHRFAESKDFHFQLHAPAGIYFVQIINGEQMLVEKIVIH